MMTAVHIAHAAATNALKASGVIVRVEPREFVALVGRSDSPLVVIAHGGIFRKHFQYLTSYKGLAFYTTSPTALILPKAETMIAKSISIPE